MMRYLRKYGLLALFILGAGTFRVWADYTLTQGAGTTFAAKSISTVLYPATLTCDPTIGETQCAAVKAASTAPAATDPAMVVSLSQNAGLGSVSTPMQVGGTVTAAQATAANLNATVVQPTATSLNATVVQPTAANLNVTAVISGTPPLSTGAATSANQSTEIASLATIATNTGAAVPAGTNLIGNVGGTVTPAGATQITASATSSGGTAQTATLAGTAGKTTYICWMSIRANATAATTVNATVTGTISGTLNFAQWNAPLASGLGVTEMVFNPCTAASAANTAIAVVSGTPGAGGLITVTAGGYQM